MLNIPLTFQLCLLAPSSCSSQESKWKENGPRKLLQVLIETSVAACVDVNMENDFSWFDLSQTNEKN